MLCGVPRTVGDRKVPCGKCFNCRINKRRCWTARILLEGLAAERCGQEVSWVTLTYAEENVPVVARGVSGEPLRSLNTLDYQLCFKRIRKRPDIGSFRYFLVGEYGDQTFRPHYHALLFGPRTVRVEAALKQEWEQDFGHTRVRPWRVGDESLTDASEKRAAYCAGYVVKKMTSLEDYRLGRARHPEFSRMSRGSAGGYGLGCVPAVLDLQTTRGGAIQLTETGDVARSVRINGKLWPLDRTVRRYLRDQLGIPQTIAEREAVGIPHQDPMASVTQEEYDEARLRMRKAERLFSQRRQRL